MSIRATVCVRGAAYARYRFSPEVSASYTAGKAQTESPTQDEILKDLDRTTSGGVVERSLAAPELKASDPADATLERRYRRIPGHENRVLRVVVNTTVVPERVVSVYFDRTMKGKL